METFTKSVSVFFICSLFFFTSKIFAQIPIINTIAGNGVYSYGGNGGMATAAELRSPAGVTLDALGNIYVADAGNNAIRVVNTSGIINTIAGNGYFYAGYSGDGGPATLAELAAPSGVVVDAIGNIYIADTWNERIREVNTSGIISTIGGDGRPGYYGDGGPATSAELDLPFGIALDGSGNIYIADEHNFAVRKINTNGIISTVAGNGSLGYTGDGGAATAAELNYPTGIVLDGSGNLYITNDSNSVVRKVNTSGIISTIAGNGYSGFSGDGGAATAAELYSPSGVAVDGSGNVYIVDYDNNVIRMVNTGGTISTIVGDGYDAERDGGGYSGDGGPATLAELSYPFGVALDVSGNIYIADQGNQRVRKTCLPTATPGPIAGSLGLCRGSSQTFSITPVAGASSYTWTLPSGWTGSSTSNSITVTVGATGGNITVAAYNSCGSSPTQTLAVNVPMTPVASICYVSVDTTSTYNQIFWSKAGLDTLAIDSFRIFRQVLSNFVQVGSVSASAYPSFIDLNSNPNVVSSLYEIGVLDTCGLTSQDYNFSQTILLQASIGVGNVVNLNWNAYVGATVSYYRILRDSTGLGNWQKLDSVSSSIFAYTDLHPPISSNLRYVINTVWNLSCRPTLSFVGGGLSYSLTSYSNTKEFSFTGIGSLFNLSSAIDVYPNPATTEISLEIHQPINGSITILNVLGQEIYADQFTSNNDNTVKQISLSGFNPGVYILKIESNGQTLVKKFVKI